jgi:hypothetical protein
MEDDEDMSGDADFPCPCIRKIMLSVKSTGLLTRQWKKSYSLRWPVLVARAISISCQGNGVKNSICLCLARAFGLLDFG